MANEWTSVQQVAKDANNNYIALVNNEWIPVASAAKDANGNYMAYGLSTSKYTPPEVPEREVTGGDVYGSSFLSSALGLSRALGGAKGETLSKAQKEEESKTKQYEEENPNFGFIPNMAGKMTVYGLAAAPGLVAANPITGGMGLLGTAAVETGLAGLPVGLGMGGEQYQRVLDATGDEALARKAAMTTGAVNALGVGLPAALGGGMLKRATVGAGLNIGANEADIATQNAILSEHPELKQEQFSGKNMLMSGLMGAGFGLASPRHIGKTPEFKTNEILDDKLKAYQQDLDYRETALIVAKEQRDATSARLMELEKSRVNGEIPTELLEEKIKLENDLQSQNERIANLEAESGAKPGGKVAGEIPAKTDVNGSRIDEQLGPDGTPLPKPETVTFKYETEGGQLVEETGTIVEHKGTQYIRWQDGTLENGKPTYRMIELEKAKDVAKTEPTVRSDFDEKMEGVSRESDVPPDLQLLDRQIDGIPEHELIKEEPLNKWEKQRRRLNEKIDREHELLDALNERIEDAQTRGSTSPYVDDLIRRRDALFERLDDYADRLREVNKAIANNNDFFKLTDEGRHKAALNVINDVLSNEHLTPDERVTLAAERIALIYGNADDGFHFIGNTANKDMIMSTVEKLHEITGQKDKMIIIQTPALSKGSFHAVGNQAILFVSDQTRSKGFDLVKRFFNREDISRAALLHNIAHEYGHFYMTKLVQAYGVDSPSLQRLMVGYQKFLGEGGTERLRDISSMPLVDKLEGENYTRMIGHYEKFSEYFAEAFNRAINSGQLPKNEILRKAYLGLRKISDSVHAKMLEMGASFNRNIYATSVINDILESNQKYLESQAREMDGKIIRSQIDAKIAANKAKEVGIGNLQEAQKQIHEYFNNKADKDYVPVDTAKVVEEQKQLEDIPIASTKIIANAFGFPQVKAILTQSPLIRAVSRAIDNADFKAESAVKALLHNVVSYDKWKQGAVWKGVVTTFKHYEDQNSVAHLLQKLPVEDFANLESVFRKGFTDGLDYAETLQKYGHLMTNEQKHAFTVLSDMYHKQWKLITDAGIDLPQRKGWYPSVRQGNHFVELKWNGEVVYRQQVRTQMGADRLAENIKKSGKYKGYEVNTGKNTDTRLETENREFIVAAIQTELSKKGLSNAFDVVEDLLDRLESKPKLGKHHEQRMNILGYKGTELFGDVKERGLSFKEAIKSSVEDFTGTYRKILIARETNKLLNTPEGLDESHPNTFYAAKLMRDMATNKVMPYTEKFDTWFKTTIDNLYTKYSGKESKLPVFDKAMGVAAHLFYIKVLTMKAGFWLSQALSSPIALRHLLRESSTLDAMASAGKGTLLAAKPDEGFLKCVYWLSQNTNVYHPSLINELTRLPMHEFLKEGTVARKIAELMTGETPSSMADSFSRYWTSAMMYEHYSKLGFKGDALYRKVFEGTNDTMIRYEKRYRAPGIQKLGMLGEQIAPLHTFAQAQWGYLVADWKYANRTGNWAPFVSTFMVSLILGGVAGLPLVTDYMLLRQAFQLEDSTPDPIDLALAGGGDTLAFGILSNSGFDLGTSLRTNPLIPALIKDGGSLWDLMPIMSGIGSTVGGIATMVKQKAGGDVSDAEYRAAVLKVLPSGWPQGLVEDLKFNATERSMVPTASGAGLVEQTGMERAASYLGVKTTERRKDEVAYQELTARDKRREEKIKKQIDILADAVSKGDDDRRLSAVLALQDLEVRDSSILDRLKTTLSSRERGLIERYVLGNAGKGTSYESKRRIFNFGEYGE